MPYKWIADEIERLDPEVDYERIWKLSTTYWVDDFQMNVLYTVGFPHFILPPHGGETVGRAGGGKIIKTKQQRADDTLWHFWRWFEYGPSDARTRASVDKVNKIHAAIGRKMPGNFAHNDDFVYTICWIAADMHRLRLRVGLPGYTHNQKISCHRMWQDMATLFVTELGDVTDFPEDFAGMLRYLADYEAVDYEYSPEGTQVCDALFDQFCAKWFPGPLRPLGRTMILALLDEPAHRVHRLPHVRPATRRAVELGLKLTFLLKEKVLPDPKLSTPERKRRKLSRKPGFRAPQHETVDTGLGVT
ncbi:MAG: hypothetical protein QOD96_2110 [Pseudonocardiales bacterium]|jgi:hypothetical protein|nr:hypothetical protein [Pseudonocardiales bacterium]